MTTPDVPHRIELTLEVHGTPEQVWHAIATADGLNSWYMSTDLEERQGGAIVTHMGEDASSAGSVTGWEPPYRFAMVEPDWAALAGHDDAAVTPLATEFLVEAKSGGTCVVRVVSSAFGTGAEWEREFFTDMEKYWLPYFDHLRLYLAHFADQRAVPLSVTSTVPAPPDVVHAAVLRSLGSDRVGGAVRARDLTAAIEHIGPVEVLLRVTAPVPGFLGVFLLEVRDGTQAQASGYFFGDGADAYVKGEEPAWAAWLKELQP
jgi:uncharacterized protein YndB with AHSA1/START domain